jgi:DNA-binding CsgD family transcriptional regulator
MSSEIKNEQWNGLFKKQKSQTSKASKKQEKPNLIDSYYFIFECDTNKISFVNNTFQTLTGYDLRSFTIEKLIDMIHPDDKPYFFACEEKDLAFTNKLLFNEHFNYLFSYTYRILTANDEYIRIKQTCQALEVNNQGHLTKTLVIHQRIEDFEERPINDHRIFDKSRSIYLDSENCYNLTKTELKILALIQEGLNSKEIAQQLCKSQHTVITHRKNILKKTNSDSFIQLLRKLSFS